MSALSELAGLLARLTGRRQPPSPPAFEIELPAVDAEEEDRRIDEPRDRSAGRAAPLLIIEYEDSYGELSRRRITVYGVRRYEHSVCLSAYCHERLAPRTFRLDRIRAVIDPQTGEYRDISLLDRMLADFGVGEQDLRTPVAQKAAMEASRPGLLVLMLVAWADGKFQDAERDILAKYVRETCRHLTDWELDPILEWASRQYPVPDRIEKTLARIVERDRDGSKMDKLLHTAVMLAEADGVVADQEALGVKAIRDARRISLGDFGYAAIEEFTATWEFIAPLPACAEALDLRCDQRVVDKRPILMWTLGNPPRHRFRPGDVFHQANPGHYTLQVSRVEDAGGLEQGQMVTFSVFQRRDDGTMSLSGSTTVTASHFEAVLRGEAPQIIVEAKMQHAAGLTA